MKKFFDFLRKKKFIKPKRQCSLYNVKEQTFKENKEIKEKKTAILIGLNYPGSHYSLNGCVNDVKNGDKYLKEHGYNSKFLEDKNISNSYNVIEALKELRDSDSKNVFFHYSGHGTQVRDTNGDEADGKDEAIYSKNGKLITDDEINAVLNTFSEDKTIFLIFDCCHSGSIADLPYIATETGVKLEYIKKNVKANIICLSGCRDEQTSADVTEKSISYGALSATLYNILRNADKNKRNFTWRQLYKQLLLEMKFRGYEQIPQLSSSDPSIFDQIVKF